MDSTRKGTLRLSCGGFILLGVVETEGNGRRVYVRECRVYAEFISNEQFRQHRKHESAPLPAVTTPARPLTATSVCRENEMDMHLMAAEKTASS